VKFGTAGNFCHYSEHGKTGIVGKDRSKKNEIDTKKESQYTKRIAIPLNQLGRKNNKGRVKGRWP